MLVTRLLPALLLLATVVPAAAQPPQKKICVDTRDIDGTDSKDGKILTIRLRNGTVLRNHLQQQCNGLVFGGFSWVLRGGNDVCEDSQTLRVLQTGEVCSLGKFDPPIKPGMKPAAGKP